MKIQEVKNQRMYQEALKIRASVFITEQNVPQELEVDEQENLATHYLVSNNQGQPIATCRTRLYQSQIKIERVAVLKEFRGQKVGWELMLYVENQARKQGFQKTILSAQTQALPFYQKLGYQVISEPYFDAQIEHYLMEKTL